MNSHLNIALHTSYLTIMTVLFKMPLVAVKGGAMSLTQMLDEER